ncbi:hypothetical protein [Listeria sp. PSOL-1]|uniref:hypothetical protein n=1 Tax=Listeria sp. PSOL-1 TaxID=1844999 RepID=UPI0013D71E00|nr:hypothetical protein [Listeria sp. PSOL-1]
MQFIKKKRNIIVISAIIAMIAIGVFLGTLFGLFQKQEVFDEYQVAYENNGKLYEVSPIVGSDIGIDKKNNSKNMYFRINSYPHIEYLFRTAYKQYEIDNTVKHKKYDGKLDYRVADNAYVIQENMYRTGSDTFKTYAIHNKVGRKVYHYDPRETSTDRYIVRIKPTILQGYNNQKNSSNDDYLNVTKLFKEKLNKNIKVKINHQKRLVIFSMEDS